MVTTSRRRALWVVAILPMLVASLLLGPALPVRGVDGTVDHRAAYSACVAAATESAGFEDMAGSFAEDAADCLAHYGITKGTAAGAFSPNDLVSRWQMALFLVRAAGPAGIVTPVASDRGFTDLGGLGSQTREAINQLAALGIMGGTSATTFAPQAAVTRRQMAVLLARFLAAAPTGPGGADIADVKPDDFVFQDIGQLPVSVHEDIRRLYEMGVTSGTSGTAFSPVRPVSRAQMAAFITRMLAHTNARPEGLSAQTTATEVFENSSMSLVVSLRDTHRRPVAGAEIDVFSASASAVAFDKDGVCTSRVSPVGARACLIDRSDETTDASGNRTATVEVGEDERLMIWSWTGELGDTFDDDLTSSATIDVTTRKDASAIEVSDDMVPTARKAHYGESVAFTFRLVDDDGNPVARPGVRFTLRVQESHNGVNRGGVTTITKETGPDGRALATFGYTDPSNTRGDATQLDLDIGESAGLDIRDATTVGVVEDDGTRSDGLLEWSDERAAPTSLVLSLSRAYQLASSEGEGAANTVRATLTDQYGDPVAREQISFTSDDSSGVPSGVRRTTNSSGIASLNYLRDSADGASERITARFDRLTGSETYYWVVPATAGIEGSGRVLDFDTDTDTIVVAGTHSVIIEYDANDQYQVGKTAATLTAFEEALSIGDSLAYKITDPASIATNSFTLTNR